MTNALPAPYPLAWPPGRPRTPAHAREKARYVVRDMADAMGSIEREVDRWRRISRSSRIVDWELTTNHIGRTRTPDDPGAAFWFELAGKDITAGAGLMVLACDKFQGVAAAGWHRRCCRVPPLVRGSGPGAERAAGGREFGL